MNQSERPVYLDCNATTPIDPRVQEEVVRYLEVEYGNASSRTHEYGIIAKRAVQRARDQVAAVVGANRDEIIFTSGATESNNIAILGLASHGEANRKKHIISTQIEHKAVLEPLKHLESQEFEITLLAPTSGGWIEPEAVKNALRPDTLLVSVMHVNNETGVIQPINEIAQLLADHSTYFHVDAAQGFGKDIERLRTSRIDMISISGHKIYAPKGIGALVTRRRDFSRPPLEPLTFGGDQEHKLRPGTLPVHLIVGLGLASELALKEADDRAIVCRRFRSELLSALAPFNPIVHGDSKRTVPHTLNFSINSVDSEAVLVSLKEIVAISNGSACTSRSYEPSHVLKSMGLPADQVGGALRLSWCHLTKLPQWDIVKTKLNMLL